MVKSLKEKVISYFQPLGRPADLLGALDRSVNQQCARLTIKGKYEKLLEAFYYSEGEEHWVMVWPSGPESIVADLDWKGTSIRLPELSPCKWKNPISHETIKTTGWMEVSDVFGETPSGLVKGCLFHPVRRAGILMHISSLAGDYGIGDFGPGAKEFIDFLQVTGQRFWQILPLSVTGPLVDFSPYSSFSAFAGNCSFVDPIGLCEMGLLEVDDLSLWKVASGMKVDFFHAEKAKSYLLKKAWANFKKGDDEELQNKFEIFQRKEAFWLSDFAQYVVLSKYFNDSNWQRWPKAYRDRQEPLMNEWIEHNKEALEEVGFQQFIFSVQWQQLKAYANHRGVRILGDMPIYISYNSADVWAHPELFRLHPDKSMAAVAGVPPDYFNEKGQLWGMPLFNWSVMAENGYDWWLKRIRKNMEWFDLLRLDHFRGFAAFWEVPAHAETAINGKWTPGPGADLFEVIKTMFPQMPFVAEDLGDIDQSVYDLRDRFGLPGMKVVQFGFEKQMPFSDHTPCNYPYNCIVYTGTHDNNTLRGWYRKEAGKETLKRFKQYTGIKLIERNCCDEMIRVAYASTAKLVVVPMQDWLELDENSRMNYPATPQGNWRWRMDPTQVNQKLAKKILKKVKRYGRY